MTDSFTGGFQVFDNPVDTYVQAPQEIPQSGALQLAEILKQVNAECEFIEEGIEDHIADDLPIYYFIDFYYIIQRNSGTEAKSVESYMKAIFNYCNFASELEDNWESLEAREESYKKFNS